MKVWKTIFLVLLMFFCTTIIVFGQGTSAKPIELSFGHLSAVGSIEDEAVKVMAKVAKEKSNGRLILNIFSNGQLGNFTSEMESIAQGTQDMVFGDWSWWGNVVKDFQIAAMAFAFRDQEHLHKFIDSPLGESIRNKMLEKNLLLLTYHTNQLPRTLVSKIPVRCPDDLKNIKMRVPEWPISLKVWKAIGTKPTSVTWTEVYLALAQGVVDAMECGYEFIYPHKFYEVAPYICLTAHVRGLRGTIINPDKYNSLPKDLQKILKEACLAGEKFYNEQVLVAEKTHTEKMIEGGATIIRDIDREAFKEKVLPIVAELEEEDFWSKGLFEKIQQIK